MDDPSIDFRINHDVFDPFFSAYLEECCFRFDDESDKFFLVQALELSYIHL